MFYAIDKDGKRVHIDETHRKYDYFCPLCEEKLVLKKGEIKAHHFAHKPHTKCTDSWTSDMTPWHIDWQNRFPRETQEIVKKYNNEKHIADILLEDKKIVIEFQHSPLSPFEFKSRNDFYNALGYKVVWLFDTIKYFENGSISPVYNKYHNYNWNNPIKALREITQIDPAKLEIYFQCKGDSKDDEIIKEFTKDGEIDFEHAEWVGYDDYINEHINDKITIRKVTWISNYGFEIFSLSPKFYYLSSFLNLFYPNKYDDDSTEELKLKNDEKNIIEEKNDYSFNTDDLYDRLIYIKSKDHSSYYYGCPLSRTHQCVDSKIDIPESMYDDIRVCPICKFCDRDYLGNWVCKQKFQQIINDGSKILDIKRTEKGQIKQVVTLKNNEKKVYNYDVPDTIFNLWKEHSTKCAIFQHVVDKFYVKITSDPNYTFQKYNGKVYGVFSRDRFKFNGKSQEIKCPNLPEWICVFRVDY